MFCIPRDAHPDCRVSVAILRGIPRFRVFPPALFSLWLFLLSDAAYGFDWSVSEIHYQYGNLKRPFLQEESATSVITFQHASGWRFGDNFLFFDTAIPHSGKADYYGEYYGNLSLGKITGVDLSIGPIKDFGVLTGINWAPGSDVLKYLPGMRIAWNLPGFDFLNSDFTAYIDDSSAKVRETNSFMVDINGRYPFKLLNSRFSIEGHIEYIGERQNPFGVVHDWLFYQIQFRHDLGHRLLGRPQKLFVGTEWQYWNNKFGTRVNESVFQALLVWRL
jgi:nucleoside-specific outer membrane channel protein Tsx